MCRLFAQLAPSPQSAGALLFGSRFSLLAQSDFDVQKLQKDGWGIARCDARGKPRIVKSPRPVFKEKEAFQKAARPASKVVVAHLRAASNPRGIPQPRLINLGNTQPFTDGRWVFAHNGTLEIPDAVLETLGPLAAKVKAHNDSEIYFWQFVKHYEALGDAVAAFQACVDEDWRLFEAQRERFKAKKTPYTSLNCLVSDGQTLHAFCHATSKGMADCAVCTPGQPWSRMSFARRGGALVVASEPADEGRWELFDPPEVLSARVKDGAVVVERRRLNAPQLAFQEAVSP